MLQIPRKLLSSSLLLVSVTCFCSNNVNSGDRRLGFHSQCQKPVKSNTALSSGADGDAVAALQSLVDFHEGTWQGKARSFTVTADIAAGVVNRKTSPGYKVSVKFGLDAKNRDYTRTETMEWEDSLTSKTLSLSKSNMDVDSEDASYSLDTSLPDLPADIIGTSSFQQFMVEHTIATSEDERARLFAIYGADQSLIRVVACEERRVPEAKGTSASAPSDAVFTAKDLIEMQTDVDRLVERLTSGSASQYSSSETNSGISDDSGSTDLAADKMDRLHSALAGTTESEQTNSLSRRSARLLEIGSGVWLGDAVIRDFPRVPLTSAERGMGFGASKSSGAVVKFGEWSVGVQKVAWRWMWNFGEEVRQVNDIGRSMGAELNRALAKDLSGSVCVNEGLSRRIPDDERMVYIDWGGENVGFLLGSVAIQVPRYLQFDLKTRPFCTEFSVFQAADSPTTGKDDEEPALPDLVCSKSSRVYNFEGRLKQSFTSFFKLKRFGSEQDDF